MIIGCTAMDLVFYSIYVSLKSAREGAIRLISQGFLALYVMFYYCICDVILYSELVPLLSITEIVCRYCCLVLPRSLHCLISIFRKYHATTVEEDRTFAWQ